MRILLVEDDQIDQMNVKRAFERNKIMNPLYVAENGLEVKEEILSISTLLIVNRASLKLRRGAVDRLVEALRVVVGPA